MTAPITVTIEDKIRQYLLQRYPGLQQRGLSKEDSLVGVLDSLAIIGLIGFIEPEFSIELTPSDVTDENFATVSAISQLIQRLSGNGN
jgi:acyl carrier protein